MVEGLFKQLDLVETCRVATTISGRTGCHPVPPHVSRLFRECRAERPLHFVLPAFAPSVRQSALKKPEEQVSNLPLHAQCPRKSTAAPAELEYSARSRYVVCRSKIRIQEA
jgi:hypothetical protein